MNLISILSLIVFILYLHVGGYVLYKNPSSSVNRWFFLLSVSIAIWSLGFIFSYKNPSASHAMLWEKISIVGSLLFPAFLIRFITLLTNYPSKGWIKSTLLSFFLFTAAGLIIYFLSGDPGGHLQESPEGYYFINQMDYPEGMILNAYMITGLMTVFFILLLWRKQMKYSGEKKQFVLLFYPFLIFVFLFILIDIFLPLVFPHGFPKLLHIFSFFWLAGISYGILRVRIFSLTPALAAELVIKEIKQLVFFCDLDYQIIKSNPYTEKLLRIRSRRLPGRKVTELFLEEKEIEDFIQWALTKGYSGPAELNLRSFQGEIIPVSISVDLVRDDYSDLQGIMVYGQDNREAIKLRTEISMRQQVEEKLKNLSDVLEQKVKSRTAELVESHKELQIKITQRQQVEEQIKADIAEKDVLINEIHNRVKSNMNLIMTLIDTHRHKGFNSKINKKFRELSQRVSAMLLIHENLYLSLNYSEVDFTAFLKELVSQLTAFYKREDVVEIQYEVSEIFLSMDHAIPLGLIVNEIISNSLNHGFSSYFLRNKKEDYKPVLSIYFDQQEDWVKLEIKDNGKGIPKDFDVFDNQTNGLPLVDVLVNDQINGSFEIIQDEGTLVRIKFPV